METREIPKKTWDFTENSCSETGFGVRKIQHFFKLLKSFKIKFEKMVDNRTQKKFEQKPFQKRPYFQIRDRGDGESDRS